MKNLKNWSYLCLLTVAFLVTTTITKAQEEAASEESKSEPKVIIEEIIFRNGDVELAGRLWLPVGEGPHPAVVFIPGSGHSIRNLDLDPDPVPFHFVEKGIAMLAWDKRGVRDSGGEFVPLPDGDETVAQIARLRLLAEDVAAAMSYLAQRDDNDDERIGVWAFSQGGWVASQLHEVGANPKFIIAVGGPAVSIGEEGYYSEIAGKAKKASRAGEGRLDMDAIYELLEEGRPADGQFGGYDPYPFLDAMPIPTLFLLGEDDLSVPTRRSVDQLEEIGNRHEWIDYRVFENASHGVATRDASGTMYMAEEFYETQFDYLGNLGIIDNRRKLKIEIQIVMDQ